MERSSSAELTDKIACYIRVDKVPPNNSAIGTAPELTTLWWNAVPGVKFVYRVQLIHEIAWRCGHIYKVWETSPHSIRILSAFVAGHLLNKHSSRFAIRRPCNAGVSPQIDGNGQSPSVVTFILV
jgi:hypothetical protein